MTAHGSCPRGRSLVAAVTRLILSPRGHGEVVVVGRRLAFPLPRPACEIERSEGRSTYLIVGRDRIRGVLRSKARRFGWTAIEQMGAAHVLTGENARLTLVSIACAPMLAVVLAAAGEGATPDRFGGAEPDDA